MPKYPPEILSLVIQAQTTPFQDDPSYAADFYEAVGRVVLLWGKLEQSLDFLVVTALNIHAQTSPRRTFVVPLGGKLDLLKTLYSDCKELTPLERDVHAAAEVIRGLGHQRHLIIHSNWLGFDDGPPPKLHMRHFGHNKGLVRISRVTPSMDELRSLAIAFHAGRSKIVQLHLSTGELVDPAIWERAQEQTKSGGDDFPPIEL
jgi:hypothetical protein